MKNRKMKRRKDGRKGGGKSEERGREGKREQYATLQPFCSQHNASHQHVKLWLATRSSGLTLII